MSKKSKICLLAALILAVISYNFVTGIASLFEGVSLIYVPLIGILLSKLQERKISTRALILISVFIDVATLLYFGLANINVWKNDFKLSVKLISIVILAMVSFVIIFMVIYRHKKGNALNIQNSYNFITAGIIAMINWGVLVYFQELLRAALKSLLVPLLYGVLFEVFYEAYLEKRKEKDA